VGLRGGLATLAGCLALAACRKAEPPIYDVGRPAASSEIAAWDIDVNALGAGLPAGGGSVHDGEAYYGALCAACHGPRGEGTATGAQLIRPESATVPLRRNIATHWPYAPPLLDYIRRAMPPNRGQPLGADTLYAIVAYLLDANHISVANARVDSATLARVLMPARGRFVLDDRRGGRELR
jgi:S-disulfanyl-L-cysteine oxidoreductase SoxD